jgi:glycosyltransferase involved in cell wall biosynthesis
MRHADLILANAPRACTGYRAAYPRHADKIATLPNGYDPIGHADRLLSNEVRVMHAGQLYAGRDPRPFLDAVQRLCRRESAPRFRVSFLGRTNGHGIDLSVEVRRRGLDAVVGCSGQVAYAECLSAMVQADILLLLDSPGRRSGVPAKVYEYLATGRPVLALAEEDSDTAWVLRESGAVHRVVPPTDALQIENALCGLAQEPQVYDASPQSRANRFTREHLACQLASLLETRSAREGDRWPALAKA